MSTPFWVSEAAAEFWERAGSAEPFPRNLRTPIAYALPLSIVLLPRLRVAGLDAWLRRLSVPCGIAVGDRPLRACLVARYGQGFIFVDGTDPADEQRFSLAHEAAHFLRDYWQPRTIAADRLGPEIFAVLDGERPPRPAERVHAVLASVQLGYHVHFMERTADGHVASADVDRAEHDADRLAFELLAPADAVLAAAAAVPPAERHAAVTRLLHATYGLPTTPAAQYAALLAPAPPRADPFLRRLGLVP
ncbi:MAG TPA: ImmA/IrrE family metallo-endopeptidase [Chloroflexota bacterium]